MYSFISAVYWYFTMMICCAKIFTFKIIFNETIYQHFMVVSLNWCKKIIKLIKYRPVAERTVSLIDLHFKLSGQSNSVIFKCTIEI